MAPPPTAVDLPPRPSEAGVAGGGWPGGQGLSSQQETAFPGQAPASHEGQQGQQGQGQGRQEEIQSPIEVLRGRMGEQEAAGAASGPQPGAGHEQRKAQGARRAVFRNSQLPYNGDLQAAMKAGDRDAIRALMAARDRKKHDWMPAPGEEVPLPGREEEYEAFKAAQAAMPMAEEPAYAPPPIDAERRSRSPGLQNNFYDKSTADFKRPYGVRGAPPDAPPPVVAAGVGGVDSTRDDAPPAYGAEAQTPGNAAAAAAAAANAAAAAKAASDHALAQHRRNRMKNGAAAAMSRPAPRPVSRQPLQPAAALPSPPPPFPAPPPAPQGNPPVQPSLGYSLSQPSEETPMPGREKEYEAFKAAQAASGQAPGGPAYAPPPIDAERRSRSPGLQNNFYEVSTADFKRPYGMSPAAPEAPPADAGDAGAGSTRDNAPLSYGAETPMPGREGEYEAFQAQGGAGAAAGRSHMPPPIDAERRSRSPGLQNNFYDKSTADFKRPHGVAPGAAPPAAPPSVAAVGSTRDNATPAYGTETPMPGREGEYEAFQAQGGAGAPDGPAYAPPPIDAERRSRSPGLQNNFYDKSTADFKRPHGVAPGAAPAAPPSAATRDNATPSYGAGREGEAFQAQGGAAVPASAPPPIDAERRSRSPGLQNNFYDLPTADFKRPHGVAPGAAPPAASVGESALPPAGYVSGGGHAPQPVGGTGIPAHAAAPASGMPEHVTRDASPAAPPVSDANGALLESICKTIDALAAVTAGDEEAASLHLEAIQRHAERSLRRRGGAGGGGGGGGGGGWGADGDAADRR